MVTDSRQCDSTTRRYHIIPPHISGPYFATQFTQLCTADAVTSCYSMPYCLFAHDTTVHLRLLVYSGHPGLDIGCGFGGGVQHRDPPHDTVDMNVRQSILVTSEILLSGEGAVQHMQVVSHLFLGQFILVRALLSVIIRANREIVRFCLFSDSLQRDVNVKRTGGEVDVGVGPHYPFHNFSTAWTRRWVEAGLDTEGLAKVQSNSRRFKKDDSIMHNYWHLPVRVELEKVWFVGITFHDRDLDALVGFHVQSF